MDDDASSGLFDRGLDGVEIERHQGAEVDDLCIDAALGYRAFGDMDHRAIGEHRHGAALPAHGGAAKRHDIMSIGNIAEFMFGPGRDGPVMMPVERTIIKS